MTDNSPIFLRVSTNSRYYKFFWLVLCLNEVSIFDADYNPDFASPDFKNRFDLEIYNMLFMKFSTSSALEESHSSICELSIIQVMLLFSFIEGIANILLSDDADRFKRAVLSKYPSMTDDWHKQFIRDAQYLFDDAKANLEKLPRFFEIYNKLKIIPS